MLITSRIGVWFTMETIRRTVIPSIARRPFSISAYEVPLIMTYIVPNETYRKRKTRGCLRNKSSRRLVLLAGLEVELVLEGEGGYCGADGKEEQVQVPDHDDRSLVGERAAVEVGESAPLLINVRT